MSAAQILRCAEPRNECAGPINRIGASSAEAEEMRPTDEVNARRGARLA
jgi:hypothetical protein